MKCSRFAVIAVSLILFSALTTAAFAQNTTGAANLSGSVPSLINYSGVLKDNSGKILTSTTAVTFLIYADEQGGSPAWMETQNVKPDSSGHYSVQLGATSSTGLPPDLFQTGQARWLALQIAGEEAEQTRMLLVAVPYAMKAADAQTLGGLPASAFLLAPSANASSSSAPAGSGDSNGNATGNVTNTSSDVTTTGGTVNTIPLFSTSTNIQNSLLSQSGTTALILGGTLSSPALGTATKSKGFDSQAYTFTASSFNSSTSSAENQTFQWQAEPASNDTTSPSGTLNLLFGLGATAPSETGLHIASNGLITFASGQTFPGTGDGTITGVTAGTGLSGGGTSGSVTLDINTSVVPELSSANTFTKNLSTSGELAAGGTAGGKIANGTVEVDAGGTNTGTYSPGLNFGGGGQSIASDRAGTVNKYGIDFYTNYDVRMSLNNAGDLGIGTTTPSHLLEVDGVGAQMAMVSSGNDAAISVKNTGTGGREYWIDSGSGTSGIGSGNFGVFDATANATRFVIGPTGNVGIGTTSPGSPLQVNSSSNFSIYASNSQSNSAAIGGEATATNGPAWGVQGVTASDYNAYGVYGLATNTYQTSAAVGVYGDSYSGLGTGVFGQYGETESSTGNGYSDFIQVGVWGDGGPGSDNENSAGIVGVFGTADNGNAAHFENNSLANSTLQLVQDNQYGALLYAYNSVGGAYCEIDASADLTCSGKINGVVQVDGGARQLAVSAITSPKNWLEDAGSGQLVNGVAEIRLDSDFIQTVNTNMDYKVFPVPNGDCKGLYITHKTATSFEVRELGGGTSSVAFDYRIMALRRNYESVRFADLTADVQRHREIAERRRARRGSGQSHDPQRDPAIRPPSQHAELRPETVK